MVYLTLKKRAITRESWNALRQRTLASDLAFQVKQQLISIIDSVTPHKPDEPVPLIDILFRLRCTPLFSMAWVLCQFVYALGNRLDLHLSSVFNADEEHRKIARNSKLGSVKTGPLESEIQSLDHTNPRDRSLLLTQYLAALRRTYPSNARFQLHL